MKEMKVTGVEIIDNSDLYKKLLKETMEKALFSIGEKAEAHAKKQSPVNTGRLRNSITFATKGHDNFKYEYTDDGKDGEVKSYSYQVGSVSEEGAVYIGTNVEYAEEQETVEMSHKVGDAHFLRDAATKHSDEYRATVLAAMQAQDG